MAVVTVNLEQGMPTVEQARIRLDQALRTGKSQQQRVLKIIHGWGSSGKGGAIRVDSRRYLAEQKRRGRIRAFVPGEDFSPFHPDARTIIQAEPAVTKDPDYARGNGGITIILL